MVQKIAVRTAPDRVAYSAAKGGIRIPTEGSTDVKYSRWIQKRIDDGDLIVTTAESSKRSRKSEE